MTSNEVLEERLERLDARVKELEDQDREIRSIMNKGYGALWVIGILGSIITFFLAFSDRVAKVLS